MADGKALALQLLQEPTERDLQVKIGASQFSSPCTRCVAKGLVLDQGESKPEKYWLGAVLGTGTHSLLEEREARMLDDPIIEQSVVVGELPGYGVIKSKPDLVLGPWLIDWKTSSKDKVKWYKIAAVEEYNQFELTKITEARFKLTHYMGQVMIYGWALNKAGIEIEDISVVFICRDGKSSEDIWSWELTYDESYAIKVWKRLEDIWTYLQEGGEPEDFKAHEYCWCETAKYVN